MIYLIVFTSIRLVAGIGSSVIVHVYYKLNLMEIIFNKTLY